MFILLTAGYRRMFKLKGQTGSGTIFHPELDVLKIDSGLITVNITPSLKLRDYLADVSELHLVQNVVFDGHLFAASRVFSRDLFNALPKLKTFKVELKVRVPASYNHDMSLEIPFADDHLPNHYGFHSQHVTFMPTIPPPNYPRRNDGTPIDFNPVLLHEREAVNAAIHHFPSFALDRYLIDEIVDSLTYLTIETCYLICVEMGLQLREIRSNPSITY